MQIDTKRIGLQKIERLGGWIKKNSVLYYWFPVLFMAGLEFYLSSKSALPQPPFFIPYLDKMEHGTLYAIMGFFARCAFQQTKLPILSEIPGICAIIFCVFYGFSDEIHQSFVPNRTTDIFDVTADSIGGIIGQWVHAYHILEKVWKLRS